MTLKTINKHLRSLLTAVTLIISAMTPSAMNAQENDSGKKIFLIINSYYEDELWANYMAQPIEMHMIKVDSVRCEREYLNNSSVSDMAEYEDICNNIFKKYEKQHPSYVALIGNFAFTLRDRIKEEWGDIPFLLISRIETYAPTEEYIASNDNESAEVNSQLLIGQLRNKYNFSAIIVQDDYSANVDLMLKLMPDMKEFVFMSDKAYVNRVAANNLENVLMEMHPDIKFRWIQGSEKNSDKMIDMVIKPHPETGILMSSWVYEFTNARGAKTLTTRDLSYLTEAVNPIFTMRQQYMAMGCVGGVFYDNDLITEKIKEMTIAMLNGETMNKIPFFIPEKTQTVVNYKMLTKFGLSTDDLPEGSIINEPKVSYFKEYWWLMLLITVCFVMVIIIIVSKNKAQRKQIATLERHTGFINNLPMPYTKAVLWLDNTNRVVNISYEMKNAAYDKLISDNSLPDNPLHLFSNTYMSEIVEQLLATGEPVSVRHHFKRTGIYCYFIFVPVPQVLEEIKRRKKGDATSNSGFRMDLDVFALDITKDHQMQQQLKDQAVTIDISMEMAQLVPWQWNAETDTISFYTYRNYSGATENDKNENVSTSMTFDEFIHRLAPSDAEKMTKIYRSIMRGEISRMDEEFQMMRSTNPDEGYEWCENHGVVTDTDSDGKPLRMTGSIQFITDRKRQQEEMAEALNKAKESDLLKSAFLANMSHEIRTPLNAIVGFSNLLTTTEDPEEKVNFAEIINRNNELLLSLINDILDLAKIESNTITLTYDLCDIHDVVSSISKTISIRVPKGVKLNVVHYADSCIVRADASHVSQILINLLTNATKFTKRGSITVGYEVYEDENKLYFYVKDTGIGIKKENIDKVFNRFVKLNNFIQGSGLGLAICRTLVEKMGGEIGVDSAGEGRGSMFWFTIPYDPMELKVEDKEEEPVIHLGVPSDHIMGEHADRPAKIEQETTNSSAFEFKTPTDVASHTLSNLPDGLTVLVAEDNPSNYWLMARLMKDKFKLHHAENGRIAVDMIDEVKPDIIVMDINMPELDGYGAVEEMRKRGVDVPIIAVTAYAFASDRIRILNSGFDAFVSKPVSASILYDTLTDVWNRYITNKNKQKDNGSTE